MKNTLTFALSFCVLSASAWPQEVQSPELRQLQQVVGQWTCTGETKISPVQPTAGKIECNWEKQNRMLLCQIQRQTGTAQRSEVFAYAYDSAAKIYTLAGLTSPGVPFAWSGPEQAGKLNLTQDGTWRNKPASYRLEVSQDSSAGTMTFIWSMSVAGGPQVITEEMKCARQK